MEGVPWYTSRKGKTTAHHRTIFRFNVPRRSQANHRLPSSITKATANLKNPRRRQKLNPSEMSMRLRGRSHQRGRECGRETGDSLLISDVDMGVRFGGRVLDGEDSVVSSLLPQSLVGLRKLAIGVVRDHPVGPQSFVTAREPKRQAS